MYALCRYFPSCAIITYIHNHYSHKFNLSIVNQLWMKKKYIKNTIWKYLNLAWGKFTQKITQYLYNIIYQIIYRGRLQTNRSYSFGADHNKCNMCTNITNTSVFNLICIILACGRLTTTFSCFFFLKNFSNYSTI